MRSNLLSKFNKLIEMKFTAGQLILMVCFYVQLAFVALLFIAVRIKIRAEFEDPDERIAREIRESSKDPRESSNFVNVSQQPNLSVQKGTFVDEIPTANSHQSQTSINADDDRPPVPVVAASRTNKSGGD